VRIGVFGGSFDPVHNAHLIVAHLAREQLGLDRVLLTVAAGQPLKHGAHAAAANHRLRMVEIAVAGLPALVADGRELRRPAPSFTVDTLRELTAEYQGAELVLVIGSDVASRFGEWREPEVIRSLARIAVCQRPGAVPAAAFDATVEVPAIDISSTAVRARAAARLPLAGWVPPAVADYIVASQLYVE
jgi:nicotinate-nucleotide adenylyltransferase